MFIESECYGSKPDTIEVTPTCVFVREGFAEFEQTDDGEPTGVTGWRYQEARMSHGEYADYVKIRAEEGLLDVQEAMAEMYEALIGD